MKNAKESENSTQNPKKLEKKCFWDLGGGLALFSASLAFSASIALFFVPKDPNGSGNGPKQNFKNNLKTCLRRAGIVFREDGRKDSSYMGPTHAFGSPGT